MADPELKVIGDWFTTTFSLAFGDTRYALKIEKARIADIVAAPKFDIRARCSDFARPLKFGASF